MPAHRSALAFVAVTLLAEAAAAGLAAPAGPAFLAPCEAPGLAGEAWCGKLPVWEDRAAAAGRRIDINVVVLPALGEETLPDPIVFIAGGPGDPSTEAAGGVGTFLAPLRQRRDVLLVDLRGTGGSNPLACSYQEEAERRLEYLNDMWPADRLPACRDELAARADLTLYTTPHAVDDLDEVRAALGYPQLNLLGVSYGTRAALVHYQRHPERVRSLTLLGPVPTDARMPLELAAATEAALQGVFADCAADAACHAAFPDPAGDLAAALARLDAGPVTVEVPAAASEAGGTATMRLNRAGFAQAIRYMLYDSRSPSRLPLVLRLAAAGDFGLVAELAAGIAASFVHLPEGVYLSVTCAEDVPYFSLDEARASAAGTMLGTLRADLQKRACEIWPRGELPAGYFEPVTGDVPALLVVGQYDPASPPSWARRIAVGLAGSLLVEVPHGAHDHTGAPGAECLDAMILRFIEQGSIAGLDPACAAGAGRPPFVTERVVEAPIALPVEALVAFAGVYVAEGGLTLTVELAGDHLEGAVGDQRFPLLPVGPTRFLPQGAPPGFALEFDREGERVTGLRLYEGGPQPIALARQ